jgi:hypothetical protein
MFGSIALLLGMLVAGCSTVDADECWPNTSGGFGGGGTIPTGAGVGATSSGDYIDPPPKEPLGDDGADADNPCVESTEEETVGIVNCSLRVDWPHLSGHKTGTINVEAKVECNAPVAGIEMTVGLARDGQEVVSHTIANSGVASLKGNVATTPPCVSGAYQGAAAALVTFPSPSLATGHTLNGNSPTLPITCP